MSEHGILPAVLNFIEQHIDTVPHMEALLLMWESRPELWDEGTLARRLYVDQSTARRVLLDLERRKLIVLHVSEHGAHAYRAAEDQVLVVDEVVRTYRRNLIAVARLIHSKGSQAMREFARAFQFKDK